MLSRARPHCSRDIDRLTKGGGSLSFPFALTVPFAQDVLHPRPSDLCSSQHSLPLAPDLKLHPSPSPLPSLILLAYSFSLPYSCLLYPLVCPAFPPSCIPGLYSISWKKKMPLAQCPASVISIVFAFHPFPLSPPCV